MSLQNLESWKKLAAHYEEVKGVQMRQLFEQDPSRFEKFNLQFKDFMVDFSKNIVTEKTLELLLGLVAEVDLKSWIEKMFTGSKINITEDRAVLHVALRNRSNTPIVVDGKDVMPEVNAVLQKIKTFTETVRSGQWKGYTGKSITDIVNIGIGGSDLGPVMVCTALQPYASQKLKAHFVSNIGNSKFRFLI
jgi:glucose-6-phosphate isomerase